MGEWQRRYEHTTMSDTHDSSVPDQHGPSDIVAGPHGSTADHGEDHGHGDHAPAGEALGSIDWAMWGVGVLGVVAALVIVAGFALATHFSFVA